MLITIHEYTSRLRTKCSPIRRKIADSEAIQLPLLSEWYPGRLIPGKKIAV